MVLSINTLKGNGRKYSPSSESFTDISVGKAPECHWGVCMGGGGGEGGWGGGGGVRGSDSLGGGCSSLQITITARPSCNTGLR